LPAAAAATAGSIPSSIPSSIPAQVPEIVDLLVGKRFVYRLVEPQRSGLCGDSLLGELAQLGFDCGNVPRLRAHQVTQLELGDLRGGALVDRGLAHTTLCRGDLIALLVGEADLIGARQGMCCQAGAAGATAAAGSEATAARPTTRSSAHTATRSSANTAARASESAAGVTAGVAATAGLDGAAGTAPGAAGEAAGCATPLGVLSPGEATLSALWLQLTQRNGVAGCLATVGPEVRALRRVVLRMGHRRNGQQECQSCCQRILGETIVHADLLGSVLH